MKSKLLMLSLAMFQFAPPTQVREPVEFKQTEHAVFRWTFSAPSESCNEVIAEPETPGSTCAQAAYYLRRTYGRIATWCSNLGNRDISAVS